MYASRFQTDDDDDVDLWGDEDDSHTCDECGCCSFECSECLCCQDCCNCSNDDDEDDEEDEELSWNEPKTEIQLTLNLDNKMQSVDWKKQTVNLIKLVGHLFSSRRPALAMSLRREFDHYDEYTYIAFEVLLHHTTEDDVKRIYNELNP